MKTYEMDTIIGLIKSHSGESSSSDISPLTNRVTILEKRIGNLQFTLSEDGILHVEEVEY